MEMALRPFRLYSSLPDSETLLRLAGSYFGVQLSSKISCRVFLYHRVYVNGFNQSRRHRTKRRATYIAVTAVLARVPLTSRRHFSSVIRQ